jgi:RNA polymerase sigma-70 factor (ECF subfamily)
MVATLARLAITELHPTRFSAEDGARADPPYLMSAIALDQESAQWLRDLQHESETRTAAISRLHALLLRVAHAEAVRRRSKLPDRVVHELDDLCIQATNDALMAILAKLHTYRGDARFTTWACKFAIYETSSRLRRLTWSERQVVLDTAIWDRLPDSAPPVLQRLENDQVMAALQRAVHEQLTDRQRLIFRSAAMEDVPIDVLAERLGTSRGAIYKTLHDARAKLRRALTEAGHGEDLS